MLLTKKVKILLALGATCSLVLITVGNGCSKRMALETDAGSTSTASSSSPSLPGEIINPNVKTVSVAYSKSFLDQVSSCVGLKSPSDATQRAYQDKAATLSTYGLAGSITAPQLMSTINIVAEVCNDLIQQEKAVASPHIFVNWDLKNSSMSTSLPSNGDIADAVSRLALSCWQNPPSAAQVSDLVGLASLDGPSRENSALMVCTAVLGSLGTLVN